ncbi:Cytochrome C' [Singulisphaera sp. GP187]|uniref:cytochrome c n=1 Tax=Singulisphaera sp. GP187 TaxID=1882752 RepID=UPI00092C8C93|nr:cytochrome c [Singulisphaera sp. GP187]SIO13609.1 Cytochrome C' [Singulisphaera sp. GP187]
MNRKWIVAIATMFSFSALVAGLSVADEGGPLHDLMEKVNVKNGAIKKATRSKVNYAKAQKELPALVEELVKLSKDAKELSKDAVKKAKNVKDAEKQWAELSDAFTKELEKFHVKVSDTKTNAEQAKSAYSPVSQSCTKCHDVFRVEEDGF